MTRRYKHSDEVILRQKSGEEVKLPDMTLEECREALIAETRELRRFRARMMDDAEEIERLQQENEAVRRAMLDATGEQFRNCSLTFAVTEMGKSLNAIRKTAIRQVAIRKATQTKWRVLQNALQPFVDSLKPLAHNLSDSDADNFLVSRQQLEKLTKNLAKLKDAMQAMDVTDDID